ncbi:MAG: DUF4296 domain-containing protein [Rikenellaceae bacterium]|jgi:hypothetical protein|nr:DUF4296 domain-containing protein [Rikenellaceae bacterium]
MKRLLIILVLAVAAAGCSRPKTIEDETLELIFRDIFLANAYCNTHSIHTDTLNIYEPILREYGYRPRDLVYSLEHYSRRKSSRLSDVLDNSINLLDEQYNIYAGRVAVLDTIDIIAKERFRTVAYTDTLITAEKVRDTARLRIRVPADEGSYKITYAYKVDTADKNHSLRTTFHITDSTGRRLTNRTEWMRAGERAAVEVKMDAPTGSSQLEILLANYTKELKTPHLRIDTLAVVHYLPVKVALDSLDRHLVDYRLLIDGTEYSALPAPDSLALGVYPPRLAAPAGDQP